MKINFYSIGTVKTSEHEIAVICCGYKEGWIFVKNRDRRAWEMPAGHREKGEDINETACRELAEETGALRFNIIPLCDYSVTENGHTGYGRLFYARAEELGPLQDPEVGEIKVFADLPEQLSHSEIQSALFRRAMEYIRREPKGKNNKK